MAKINFILKSKENPSNIYCRFVHGRGVDAITPIDIYINPKDWDLNNQELKFSKRSIEINKKLTLLKLEIIDQFSIDFSDGEHIDSYWLKNVVLAYFNRPETNKKKKSIKHKIYLTKFINWWIEEKAAYWETGPNQVMNTREIKKNQSFLEIVKQFQGKDKIKFRDLNHKTVSMFAQFLADEDYAPSTISRQIRRFKFYCFRAEEEGILLSKTFKQRVYIPKAEEIKHPYLTMQEIQQIFDYDFSYSDNLENVRDTLIIAVWTGLRISDFMRLNIENFVDDFIEIETLKTKTSVVIPLHSHIKEILIKRNGKLPAKTSDSSFNKKVKEVCKAVGINKSMIGKVYSSSEKRKVTGTYPKYKLISSHTGRRSFCTNLVGHIEDNVIMKIAGWSSKEMMYKYIKTTNREYAEKLKQHWDKEKVGI